MQFIFKQNQTFYWLLFIAKSNAGNQDKKASMMYLSQEVRSKDQQLKTQMAVSFQDDETKNNEKVWQKSGFFDDRRSDLTTLKASFP